MKWWQKTIIYECYPKSFLDTKASGTGTIAGVTSKLDYLKKLGAGGIWLTPVFSSAMKDNGYDVSDYMNINPLFGTMEDMKDLIDKAGQHGIRIILDLVFNHTSDQNAWFLESKKDKSNDMSDWYIWHDPKADGSAPTNWRSIFGGPAWTYCRERGQYYLHTFAPYQPDLNWQNPAVRRQMADITNFWINQGAGGFRIDAITYIRKPDVFKDGPVDGKDGLSAIHPLTANQPGILDYLQEYRDHLEDRGRDIFLVGEANGVKAEELPLWVGKGKPFDMLFEFSHMNLQFKKGEIWCRSNPFTVMDLKKALNNSQENTKDTGWYPVFLENHDQPRSVNHFFPHCQKPEDAAKLLAVLLMTMRGTPFIYQGEELGMMNAAFSSIDQYDDISSKGQYDFALKEGFTKDEALSFVQAFSRDNARIPMPWNAAENAGFTTGKPWLSIYPGYKTINAQAEEKDQESVLNWYRKLHEIRQEHPALLDGSYEPLFSDHPDLIAYKRKDETECLTVILNCSEKEIKLPAKGEEVLLSSLPYTKGILRPYQGVIIQNEIV